MLGTMFCMLGTKKHPNWSTNGPFLLGRRFVCINIGNLMRILRGYIQQCGLKGWFFRTRKGRRCLDDPYRLGIPNLKLFVDTMIYLAGSMLRKTYNSGIAWPVTLWSSICDETNCFSAIFLLECFLTGLCPKGARHPAIRHEMK